MTRTYAARRAFNFVSGHFFLFLTPVFAATFFCRGLLWAMHRLFLSKLVWLEILLLFVVCMPLSFLAEAAVSSIYLRRLQGDRIGLRHLLTVGSYPGAAGLISRLLTVCALWLVPAVIAGVTLSLLMKPMMRHVRPDTHLVLAAKGTSHLSIVVFLVLYAAVISRYSFVMPLLAVRRSGGAETFRTAVQRMKGSWGLFAFFGVAEYLAVHFASQWGKHAAVWRGGRPTAVLAEILFSSVLVTYFAAFKTDLLAESGADPR